MTGFRFGWPGLIVALALTACQQMPPASPAPSIGPTRTPGFEAPTSVPATPTPGARATTALTATRTPIPIVLPTLPATVTPLAPPAGDATGWRLREWGPEAADERIGQMAAWLEHHGERPDNDPANLSTWLVFHSFLADAEAEALLRYPDAQQAERWRWDRAYNLAAAGGPGRVGGEWEVAAYVDLIQGALDTGQATLDTLPDWFAAHEPRMALTVQGLQAPAGFDSAALVVLDRMAYLWVGTRSDAVTVSVLDSDVLNAEAVTSDVTVVDLTGDGLAEIVLAMSQISCCDVFRMTTIYDLSSGTPQSLSVSGPGLMSTGSSAVEPWTAPGGRAGFLFQSVVALYVPTLCSVNQTDHYAWTGDTFEWLDTAYTVLEPGPSGDAAVCADARSLPSDDAEREAAVSVLRDVTASGLSAGEWQLRLRYRLGEAAAREGHARRANELFAAALEVAVAASSGAAEWRESAQHFLEADANASYYAVCAGVTLCDTRAALTSAIAGVPVEMLPSLVDQLDSLGVDVRSSGDLPSLLDAALRWLVVADPHGSTRELWLVAADGRHLQARFVIGLHSDAPTLAGVTSSDRGVSFVVDATTGPITVEVTTLALSGRLQVARRPQTQTATVATGTLASEMGQLRHDLLAGVPPAPIAARAAALADPVGCPDGEWCRPWLYLWGLAAELAGDDATAAAAYVQLWQIADGWPIGLWARLRLERVP